MRVGIFGASFNPPRIGDYRAALEVAEALDLEKVITLDGASSPSLRLAQMDRPRSRSDKVKAR